MNLRAQIITIIVNEKLFNSGLEVGVIMSHIRYVQVFDERPLLNAKMFTCVLDSYKRRVKIEKSQLPVM